MARAFEQVGQRQKMRANDQDDERNVSGAQTGVVEDIGADEDHHPLADVDEGEEPAGAALRCACDSSPGVQATVMACGGKA
jgi:hypothetical protein